MMNRTKEFKEMKKAIETIVNSEHREEAKLNLLTSIGLDTDNEVTFMASEDVRNDLCEALINDEIW